MWKVYNIKFEVCGNMEIRNKILINDFGPIKKANIEVAPLTIFMGPNSSGKSFSSLLLHSFYNPYNEMDNVYKSTNLAAISLDNLIRNKEDIFNEFKYELNEYMISKPKLNDSSFEFPLEKFLTLIHEGFGKCYTKILENKLKSNWNTNLNKLNNINSDSFKISFNDNYFVNEHGKLILKELSIDLTKFAKIKLVDEINSTILKVDFDETNIKINLNYILLKKLLDENWDADEIDFSLAHLVYLICINKITDLTIQNSYYVPAAGDELLKDINNYLSGEINGLVTSSIVQKQLITNLLKSEKKLEKGFFYDLACNLEKELINGEIKFKSTDLKDELIFVDNKFGLELELSMVSSSIRELIPIIIYLKYFLKKGDILILEEVENHLHPKNQLILVKYLVEAINDGLNIILTTHSDYILEKINNFIRLGNANKIIFDELGYDDKDILNYEQVKIYNFKKLEDYCFICDEVSVNFTGFDEDNFSKVIEELYGESEKIIDNKLR